ncbi:MAG: dihydroorotate dehydrogenase electron transfer subunit [Candidatus Aminicenantes bacterium]|nr:dihydroorotate dehydrogenase electron transfer subunit [Candidatus Aminicenantes bacterium]
MVKDPKAHITHKDNWGDYFSLSMVSAEIALHAQPGQFIMVRTNQDPYPLLRRPFSIFSADEQTVTVFFQKVGLGTDLLSRKQEGDMLDIIGPLGKGFSIPNDGRKSMMALVGGGRGIAPLFFLAEKLRDKGIDVRIYYGGKSGCDLPLKVRLEAKDFVLCCSTEDGSIGYKGTITEALDSEIDAYGFERIYACGPEAMLHKVAQTAQAKKLPAELSLESIMGCGFGACWGCVKKIKKEDELGWRKICEEGPVFAAQEIYWE